MVRSLVRISACRAAVLALASWRSFSREAILAGSASRASSFSVTVSRMDNLAMIASYYPAGRSAAAASVVFLGAMAVVVDQV
jgi:hypothetical protein